MRKMLLFAVLFTGSAFSQEKEPNYEIEGALIKVTYFHDNGKVKEQGFYKDGKVHGKWVSYNEDGSVLMSGEYANGVKTGKWRIPNSVNGGNIVFVNNRVQKSQYELVQNRRHK